MKKVFIAIFMSVMVATVYAVDFGKLAESVDQE
jgi:hypothetical protein